MKKQAAFFGLAILFGSGLAWAQGQPPGTAEQPKAPTSAQSGAAAGEKGTAEQMPAGQPKDQPKSPDGQGAGQGTAPAHPLPPGPPAPPGYQGQPPAPPAGGQQGYAPPRGYPPPQGYPPPPYGYYPPAYYGYRPPAPPQPPPPPKPDPSIHCHDGLYLSLDFGLGFIHDSQTDSNDNDIGTVRGAGTSFAFGLGGTIGSGLVLAGLLQATVSGSPTFHPAGKDPRSMSESVTHSFLGVMGDYFFDPHGGAHLQLLLGTAGVEYHDKRYESESDKVVSSASTIGLGLGGGYDWWVGEQWSMGVIGRVFFSPRVEETAGTNSKDIAQHGFMSATIGLQALLH